MWRERKLPTQLLEPYLCESARLVHDSSHVQM